MGCLDTPTSGEVWIAGERVARLGDGALSRLRRDRIGFVFQGFSVIPVLTALENVEYPLVMKGVAAAARRRAARSLLEEVGLGAHCDRYPNRLSGGQLQRVAIARALAGEPALLLADEPTAHLDSATSREILGLLRSANERRGSTLVIATHDAEVMRFAQRVIRLHDGTIVSDASVTGATEVAGGADERQVVHGF
jgi:putative ABC transport system ATP-binding protein